MVVRIRKAVEKDAGEISLMRKETLRETSSKDYSDEIMEMLYKRNSAEKVLKKMLGGVMFCMVSGDRILGTVDLEDYELSGLYIRNGHRGKGIGKKLLVHMEDYARDKGIKKLMIYPTAVAEGFYEKYGYRMTRNEVVWEDICPTRVSIMEKVL